MLEEAMTEDAFIGRELLGQFRILERIGKGGMGSVYKAEQPAMDRMVAVKILHPNLADRKDIVSRFRREARAMSRLTHPNTVRVFLYGQLEDNSLYIVMECLEGANLYKITRQKGPFEVPRAAGIMVQVLGALDEAHSMGVVHRDLKPENIFLTEQGGMKDFPKVLDFGLAKIKEPQLRPGSMILTQEGMVFGTPEFMSPEQASGEILDPRTDIYSIGVILYEMVTGLLPFDAKRPMEFITHHIKTPPIPVTERAPGLTIDPRLNPILMHALEKDKTKRFQTAREFADALKPIAGIRATAASSKVPTVAFPKAEAQAVASAPAPARPALASEPASDDTIRIRKSTFILGIAGGIVAVLILALIVFFALGSPAGHVP